MGKRLEPGTPEQAAAHCAAWISPEGDIYPCRPWSHGLYGVVLADQFDVDFMRMEELGWVRWSAEGISPVDARKVTQRALGAVIAIYGVMRFPSLTTWLERLKPRGERAS